MKNHKGAKIFVVIMIYYFLMIFQNTIELKQFVWQLILLCVSMTPFFPYSSKYLIHINSLILTAVEPERVDGKYNPLDTEGRVCLENSPYN